MPVPDRSLLGEGDREGDEEERDADPVVEAGLDVQALTDPYRQSLRRDDGLAERGVGRGEDDRDEERLGPRRGRRAATSATTKPARIVSGSPIPSRRAGMLQRTPQSREVDARRVGEEDDGEGGLGEDLDLESRRASGSTRPSASTPTTSPAAVKTIGAVIGVPSMRREIAAKPRRMSASVTSCQCTRRSFSESAAHVLEADRASQPVERAVERVVERGGAPYAALEVERLHDERSLAALGLEVGATDDAVAPEERQDVVAELALVLPACTPR